MNRPRTGLLGLPGLSGLFGLSGLLGLVGLSGLFLTSCESPTAPRIQNPAAGAKPAGLLAVWTSAQSGWDSIAVSIDGVFTGTLTSFLNREPGCGGLGEAVVPAILYSGTHTITAVSNEGATWSMNVDVPVNECKTVELTCPNRDCSTGGDGHTTSVRR